MGLAVRFGRRPEGLTLAEYFRRCGQGEAARRLLWDPLALAVLNEPVERAAAVLFHRVYQEAFLRDHRASRLVFLRRGWGALLERVASLLRGAGGRRPARRPGRGARRRGRPRRAACATPSGPRRARRWRRAARPRRGSRGRTPSCPRSLPTRCAGLLPEEWRARPPFAALARFGGSPIVSVEMWLDRVVVDRPMLGLRDSEVEWVFDKGRLYGRAGAPQHLAFIVSAAYRSASKTNAELVAAAEGALRRYFPAMAGATRRARARPARPARDLRLEPRARGAPPRPGHADRGALPRRRLDGHRPARHDRGRRAQRAARGAARARLRATR